MTSSSIQDNIDSLDNSVMSVVLISPDDQDRRAISGALAGAHNGLTQEMFSYPRLDDVPHLMTESFDVVIVAVDADPEYALDLVECICSYNTATVMIYSAKADRDLLVRCMRAGAREFLTQPIAPNVMAEALVRASVRRPGASPAGVKKTGGKLAVFIGAKGGSGVSTLACNFAVSMAKESEKSVLLIDLDLPLGDAGLNLGISSEYSTVNALQNSSRLDTNFLSKLLVKHSSGLSVLGAPGKFVQSPTDHESIDKLLTIARQSFDYVVVDAGNRLDLNDTALFDKSSTIYLVTQVSIPELRNSNRLITSFFQADGPRLEIVINRYTPRSMGVEEEHITKALTRPATWKVPNDYASIKRTQNTGTPLSLEDSPISRVIRQMARSMSGLPASTEQKKKFSLFAGKN